MLKYLQNSILFRCAETKWHECVIQQSPLRTRAKVRDIKTIHSVCDRESEELRVDYFICITSLWVSESYKAVSLTQLHGCKQCIPWESAGINGNNLLNTDTGSVQKPDIIDIRQDVPRAPCYEVIWSIRGSIEKHSAGDSRAMEERTRWRRRIQRLIERIKPNRKFCQSRCEMKWKCQAALD